MNTLEDQLREALDGRASARAVDVDALWRATEPRLRRKPRTHLIAIAAVAAAGVGVAAVLGIGALTSTSRTVTPAGTPSAVPSGSSGPEGDLAYEPHRGYSQRLIQLGNGHNLYPAKVRSFRNGGRYAEVSHVETAGGKWLECVQLVWLSGPKLPQDTERCLSAEPPTEPEDPAADPLTLTHTAHIPLTAEAVSEDFTFEFATGRAAKSVARVVGVDDNGKRYDGVFSDWSAKWERREYFLATLVKLAKVEAYDDSGKLLATVPVAN